MDSFKVQAVNMPQHRGIRSMFSEIFLQRNLPMIGEFPRTAAIDEVVVVVSTAFDHGTSANVKSRI